MKRLQILIDPDLNADLEREAARTGRSKGAVVRGALRWLRRHDERPYSFVDATSFLVMRDLKIADVLTFDADFTAAGLRQVSS